MYMYLYLLISLNFVGTPHDQGAIPNTLSEEEAGQVDPSVETSSFNEKLNQGHVLSSLNHPSSSSVNLNQNRTQYSVPVTVPQGQNPNCSLSTPQNLYQSLPFENQYLNFPANRSYNQNTATVAIPPVPNQIYYPSAPQNHNPNFPVDANRKQNLVTGGQEQVYSANSSQNNYQRSPIAFNTNHNQSLSSNSAPQVSNQICFQNNPQNQYEYSPALNSNYYPNPNSNWAPQVANPNLSANIPQNYQNFLFQTPFNGPQQFSHDNRSFIYQQTVKPNVTVGVTSNQTQEYLIGPPHYPENANFASVQVPNQNVSINTTHTNQQIQSSIGTPGANNVEPSGNTTAPITHNIDGS